jgi:spermidine synthase
MSGKWSVQRFTLTEQDAMLFNIREVTNLKPTPRPIAAGTYTRLCRGMDVIMSDTPAEMIDHEEVVRRATGRCLVAGLGLGMVTVAMLDKPEVTQVTVVEQSSDVLALVQPTLKAKYPSDRLRIVQGNILESAVLADDGPWDVAWFDIWDNIYEDNLEDMARLKRMYRNHARWMGCWAERECRLARKRRY